MATHDGGLKMKVFLRISGGELEGTRLFFPPGQYVFGRGQGCHVLFAASSIASRRHCLLKVTDSDISIRDLCSRNGTLINNKRFHGEAALSHGDLLRVGETTFHVEVVSADDAEPGVEVTGKPLNETIEVPVDRTACETKLSR
jgi:pSer/pThr/pTyr-binding forkhead associated (FHA) protein